MFTDQAPRAGQNPAIHRPAYVEPRRPAWRRTLAIVVILVVVGSLILSILTQPWGSTQLETTAIPLSALGWIAQILVSFMATLAALAELSGWNVRELFGTRPAGASAEAFPFHIIRDLDELLDHLLPDPTTPLLPDRSIPFLPRIADQLDDAFRQGGRVLVRGRSKTGKTREAVELLRRWWYTGPTVLLAKNHVGLYPPYPVPETLPIRNLVLFFDDVDRYCGDADAIKRLGRTIAFFADLCREPGELRVIATARQEPECWSKLDYDASTPPWDEFELLSLPALPVDGARRLIDHLAQFGRVTVEPAAGEDMAAKNDGTFLNLVLSFRSWLHEGLLHITSAQAAVFEGSLLATWRQRYERLLGVLPEIGPIYAAVNLLQALDMPLRPALIADLATEMSLSRAYHLLDGLFHAVQQKIALSPWLDWYRDPRRRRKGFVLGILFTLLALYGLFYALFCLAPASLQYDFFSGLADELWLQLLFVSPLLVLLAPPGLSLALHWRHWRQRRRVGNTLDQLLTTEVPLRESELRAYEGQFEGQGTSRAWPLSFFAGQSRNTAVERLAALRLAAFYWPQAEALRAAGDLAAARCLAGLAHRLAPAHPTPPFVLGRLWYDDGGFQHALAEFARSRVLNPNATAALALERMAWCFYQLKEFALAERAAGQALVLMPTLPAAHWARGLARLRQDRAESGLADCRQATRVAGALPPDLTPALEAALEATAIQSLTIEVRHLLQRAGAPPQRHATLWRGARWGLAVGMVLVLILAFLLGVPYLSRKLDENASFGLPLMNLLLRLYPRAPILVAQRGYAYYNLGDYEQATADCSEAIRLDPEYAVAYNNRGYAYCQLGDYEQAIADCSEAIRLDPEYAVAYRNRGAVYYDLGDYEQAIADYSEAIRLEPDLAAAYNNRGYAYRQLGDYEQAIADYSEAIRLDPEYAVAYNNRGAAYQALGNLAAARADWTRAIELLETQDQADAAEMVRGWLSVLGE